VAIQYGLLNFNLSVDRIGGTAVVEIYLSGNVSENAQAYKYDTVNGWYAFPVQFKNGTYVIEIKDGGLGEIDGVAKGGVVDPIGLSVTNAVSANIKSDGVSGGGGGCFISAAGTGISDNWLRYLFSFLFSAILAIFKLTKYTRKCCSACIGGIKSRSPAGIHRFPIFTAYCCPAHTLLSVCHEKW
jgi:hypothetical protein